MEWSTSYEQNDLPESLAMRKISPFIFNRTKKCLFGDSEMMDVGSPLRSSPRMLSVEHASSSPLPDSPFSLFRIKKQGAGTLLKDQPTTPARTRNILSDKNAQQDSCSSPYGEGTNCIKLAVQKSIQDPNLIGDFSKSCLLPVITGKHPDLKSITPQTMATLLKTKQKEKCTFIDCRYPYEYKGGHIMGAKNICTKEDSLKEILNIGEVTKKKDDMNILIFYCEFSSERAPSMYRFVRGQDRDLNKDSYPNLFYPEMYLMDGGYKAFFQEFKELCEPQEYTTMSDKKFSQDLIYFRTQSKTWNKNFKKDKRKARSLVSLSSLQY